MTKDHYDYTFKVFTNHGRCMRSQIILMQDEDVLWLWFLCCNVFSQLLRVFDPVFCIGRRLIRHKMMEKHASRIKKFYQLNLHNWFLLLNFFDACSCMVLPQRGLLLARWVEVVHPHFIARYHLFEKLRIFSKVSQPLVANFNSLLLLSHS